MKKIKKIAKTLILLAAVALGGLFALSTNDTWEITGTCQSSEGEQINLVGDQVDIIKEDKKALEGILRSEALKIACLKGEIKHQKIRKIMGKPIKGNLVKRAVPVVEDKTDHELRELKKLEKKVVLVKGRCENSGAGERLVNVTKALRDDRERLVIVGIDEVSDELVACHDSKISYKLAGQEFVENYKTKNLIDIEGKNVLLTGACLDSRENRYELVGSMAKIISLEDGVAKAGIPSEKVIVECDPSKSGKFTISPIVKKKEAKDAKKE